MHSAKIAPIRSEPVKMRKNSDAAKNISSLNGLPSTAPIFSTVSYITIPIASLKIDSPKTIAKRLTSASISLKMARTETGSVALIKLPNANDSFQENSGERLVWPTKRNKIDEVNIAIKVPKNEYANTVPKLAKNGFLFILKPESKIMGGSSKIMNKLPKCLDKFVR